MRWRTLVVACISLAASHGTAEAAIQFIGFGPPPTVSIRIGQQTGISEVQFNLQASEVGNGVPIQGSPPIPVEASGRAPFGFPLPVFTLTVDSSVPLSNGADTLSFTEFSWQAQDGDIPSGTFDASTSQVILGPVLAFFSFSDQHTFFYSNARVIGGGTYTGRVTYTAAFP